MHSRDLLSVNEAELRAAYAQVASHVGLSAVAIQMEFQRRASLQLADATEGVRCITAELAKSSRRLERLTVGLFVLTVLVLFAALPPAIEIASKFFGHQHTPTAHKPVARDAATTKMRGDHP